MEMPTLQKCNTSKDHLMLDRLNELPDEILANILCLVTMKEAAQTSILTRRWKDLWKYTTCLDFDMMHKLQGEWVFGTLEYQRRCVDINDVIDRLEQHRIGEITPLAIFRQKRLNYVKWVDGILDSLKSPTICKFRVHFDLDVTFQDNIDRWVNFVIGKRVQMLDLDLEKCLARKDLYPFPIKILDRPNILLLRSLSLNNVDLTNQVLDTLVSKIPCIESLRVSESSSLINTYIFIAPPSLKHLEISKCENLRILQIIAFDLKSLTYYGVGSSILVLKDTPNLVDVSFGGEFCHRPNFILPKEPETSHFCYRLQSLTLKIPILAHGYFPDIPILGNVKQLELLQKASDLSGILNCSSLILACPSLCKFILGIDWWSTIEKGREIERKKCLLPNSLKEVKLHKFRGGTTDVEIAMFLFENALSLEKICIDTRDPGCVDHLDLDQTILEAKKCGMQLAAELCPKAELRVL